MVAAAKPRSMASSCSSFHEDLNLPPGFRFHPTDDELVTHYLLRRCAGRPVPAPIIAEIDLYKYDPWDLPGLSKYGEREWYFFSPRDRKYPNGSRPNRVAGSGYWKATGADKPVGSPRPVAIKKALVFYAGRPPKGQKTDWIMHEYRLAGVDRSARNKINATSLRLDEWVLCRIYNKKGVIERPASAAADGRQKRPAAAMLASSVLMPIKWEMATTTMEADQDDNDKQRLLELQRPVPSELLFCFDHVGGGTGGRSPAPRPPQLQQAETSSSEQAALSSSVVMGSVGDQKSNYWMEGWEESFVMDSGGGDAAAFVPDPAATMTFEGTMFGDPFSYISKPF